MVEQEEPSGHTTQKKRGKLKIYFGYAAGVGKTCAMLQDAHQAQKNGVDVVAGYIEPHVRSETVALAEGLNNLLPLEINYKTITLKEFNLDAALQRNPSLILVDELAHTNAQGCRHKKRYQDVEELLQAGIDVYTTINVQHLESLNDIVQSITGVYVKERIPDSIFDSADQIELVDIEPADLIERLNKGKIYREEQVQRALSNFFTKEKLIALREIALRRTADQVNKTALLNEPLKNSNPHTNEHILICLSSAPSNSKVIRTAARMADAFHGNFTALFVETSKIKDMEEKDKNTLAENIRLAEQLGAQILTMYGDDIPLLIAECAKASRVSKIVIGRSSRMKRWLKSNYVDRLSELAPGVDIHIIPDTQSAVHAKRFKLTTPTAISFIDTVKSAGLLILCTLIGFLFEHLGFSTSNIITIYILGILANALVTKGRLFSAVSSVLSVLIFNYFFTEPRFSFQAYDPGYFITFFVMFAASLITSTLTKRVTEQARQSAQKAYRTEILLETSRKLQQAKDQTDIIGQTAQQIIKLLDRTIIVYPSNIHSLGEPLLFPKKDDEANKLEYTNMQEKAIAEWVYKNNKRAGATTNTFSAAKCLYLAIRGNDAAFAVLGIAMNTKIPLDTFQKNILIAMLDECGLALEKEQLHQIQKQTSIQMEQEQLRANLLRAISHDLRTPLTSISGNAGILIGNSSILNETQKNELYNDIYYDSMWLINLVENLLSITRIDNGTLNLNLQPELLEEVISEALSHINRNSIAHHINIQLSDHLLMAKMDSRLIIQVIINLVDNAITYTSPGTEITVSAERKGQSVLVEIADTGNGIADAAKEKIFDMFYTGNNIRGDGRRGLGIGLSLCKSIIHAHGGTISITDNTPHGAVFSFNLQAEEVNFHE